MQTLSNASPNQCILCGATVGEGVLVCYECRVKPHSDRVSHDSVPAAIPEERGPKTCAQCGLINPASTEVCDCGFSFVTSQKVTPPAARLHYATFGDRAFITPNTEGRVAFVKLASDSIKNVIFFGVGVGVIMGIGSHARWLGLLLFGIHALTTVLQVAGTVFATVLGVVSFLFKLIAFRYKADDFWWDMTNLVQLIEDAIHVLYFVILYRFFFQASAA